MHKYKLSSAYLIEKYSSAEDQVKRKLHLKHIVLSVNMLTGILNDLLSVGKIEEGKLVLNMSPTLIPICYLVRGGMKN